MSDDVLVAARAANQAEQRAIEKCLDVTLKVVWWPYTVAAFYFGAYSHFGWRGWDLLGGAIGAAAFGFSAAFLTVGVIQSRLAYWR